MVEICWTLLSFSFKTHAQSRAPKNGKKKDEKTARDTIKIYLNIYCNNPALVVKHVVKSKSCEKWNYIKCMDINNN